MRFTHRNSASVDVGGRVSLHSEDAVLNTEPFDDSTFGNEHRLVQPRVAGVTGLESRRGPEVLVFERCRGGASHGRLHLLVHVQEPVIAEIDEGPIVGLYLGTHIEPAKSVGAD